MLLILPQVRLLDNIGFYFSLKKKNKRDDWSTLWECGNRAFRDFQAVWAAVENALASLDFP